MINVICNHCQVQLLRIATMIALYRGTIHIVLALFSRVELLPEHCPQALILCALIQQLRHQIYPKIRKQSQWQSQLQ